MAINLLLLPILVLFAAFVFIFLILMLIDSVTRKFDSDTDKVIWVLVIVFVNFVGALVYYFAVYRKYKSLKWFWLISLGLAILYFLVLFLFIVFYIKTDVSIRGTGGVGSVIRRFSRYSLPLLFR